MREAVHRSTGSFTNHGKTAARVVQPADSGDHKVSTDPASSFERTVPEFENAFLQVQCPNFCDLFRVTLLWRKLLRFCTK